jgi:hypothetical protein
VRAKTYSLVLARRAESWSRLEVLAASGFFPSLYTLDSICSMNGFFS